MVKMNIFIEIDNYMKRAIRMGCTDEEMLKRRAYGYALGLVSDGTNRDFLRDVRAFINANVMNIRSEFRKGGEDFTKVTLEEVRRRMTDGYRRIY